MGESSSLIALLGGIGGFAGLFWKYIDTKKAAENALDEVKALAPLVARSVTAIAVLETRASEQDKAYKEVREDVSSLRAEVKDGFQRLMDKMDQLKH
jgi:hypothetical protein